MEELPTCVIGLSAKL